MPRVLRNFLIVYLLLHLVAAGLFVGLITGSISSLKTDDLRDQMQSMAIMLNQHVAGLGQKINDPTLPSHVTELGKKTSFRFTLIDEHGTVVADSETGTRDIGSHADRPEVLQATTEKAGFSTRYSKTLETQMLYLAIPLTSDQHPTGLGYVRVASKESESRSAIRAAQSYFWTFALGLGLLTGILMAIFVSQSMKPLGQFADAARKIGVGDYESFPSLLNRHDEWRSLSDAFQTMQTEMETREQRIVRGRDRLQAVLSSMIEGVVAISPTGEIRIANRAACKMFGFEESELRTKKFIEVVRDPDLASALARAQNEGTFAKTEFQTSDEGSRRTISARASVLPVQNPDEGETPGVVVVLNDITDLRNLELMRQDFAANVSHELKTPLASIRAYAETLKMGAINDQEKNVQFVEEIERQADFLNQQIQDLLQIARIESGNHVWDIESVDLNEEIQLCISKFETLAANGKVEIQFEPNDENPRARADIEGIQTLLGNLVSNALNYTPAGGTVTVAARYLDDSAVLEVSDTGIGIAPEHHSRLFERFYRLDKARSRDKGGTGLGLSIVKHLTQSFGGSIEFESEPGKGTRFRIKLPKFVQ